MKSRLTCTILALATISLQTPKKITQEKQMGSERALFGFSAVLVENEQDREKERGYGGYLYPLS
jgi:hypothetical protein